MKQTAVEFLVDNLHYLHSTKWDDILEQAKEMEKEQIIDAVLSSGYVGGATLEESEDYYNENYNK